MSKARLTRKGRDFCTAIGKLNDVVEELSVTEEKYYALERAAWAVIDAFEEWDNWKLKSAIRKLTKASEYEI